jgi:hypothetical protein
VGDPQQSEQDKWMAHPSVGVDVAKLKLTMPTLAPSTMGRPPAPTLKVPPLTPPASDAPVKVVDGTWPPAKGGFDPLDMKPLKDAAARQGLYGERVKTWLRAHKYTTDESGLVIDGKCADYGPVIRELRPQLNKDLTDDQMTSLIDGAAKEMRDESGKQLQPIPPAPATKGAGNAPALQLAWNFVPVTCHVDTSTGQKSQDGSQYQAQAQYTFQLHEENKRGVEISAVANFTFDAKTRQLLNGGGGGQVAWVEPFFDGTLQVQMMVSALIGSALSGQPSNGSTQLVPVNMLQVATGVQVMYAVPGFNKHLQVGFQLAPSITKQGNTAPTVDFGPAAIVQVQW